VDRTQHQSYEPWNVGAFPRGLQDVQSLVYDGYHQSLKIDLIFHNTNQVITVTFLSLIAYRVIDEGYRLKQVQHLPQPMNETIYIVSRSDMVDELIDEAGGMLQPGGLFHYFIVTMNDCIDVITYAEPQLECK
jgi:hypothetical protein